MFRKSLLAFAALGSLSVAALARPLPRLNTARTPAGEDSCGEMHIRATTCACGLGSASKRGATIGGLRIAIGTTTDATEPTAIGFDRAQQSVWPRPARGFPLPPFTVSFLSDSLPETL